MVFFFLILFALKKMKTKVSGDSFIYKINFSQTKSEPHHRVGTHVKIRDHKVATPLVNLEVQSLNLS